MEISTESSINDGVLLTSSKNKSSVDGIIKDASNQMMNLTQARDDIDVLHEEIEITEERHTIFVSAIKDVTTESGSRKQSTSLQEVGQNKAPVALYRSRTDKKSSPVSEDIVTPASLHRSRTATPQISSKRSSPTFSDMKAEEAEQADVELKPEEVKVTIKPEEVEVVLKTKEVEVESEPEEEFAQVESEPEEEFAQVESEPEEEFAQVESEPEEEFAQVESEPEEEFAQVESEPEEEFARVVEMPSVAEDNSFKSSSKKSKWLKKMRGCLAKK